MVTEVPPDRLNATFPGLAPGTRVAGYELEGPIGSGGMAVVFRARDEQLDRVVALKFLPPGLAADEEFRRRFIQESRALATVEDPHIIPVYAAGEVSGVLYIAMRYVAGGDLRALLGREGALPPNRAAELLSPVAAALDAAHSAGLVHRDVKPANILVDSSPGRPDHVYLSDFGLSKGTSAGASLTGSGFFLGTPEYSAPEQVSGAAVDGRADQYALACVAFHALAGRPPFAGAAPIPVLMAHATQPPPSLTALRPELPAAVDAVLARALAKAPGDRYASCARFTGELRRALGLPPYESPAPGQGQPLAYQGGAETVTARPRLSAAQQATVAAPPARPEPAATPAPAAPPARAVPDTVVPAPAAPASRRTGAGRRVGPRGRARAAIGAAGAVVIAAVVVPLLTIPGSGLLAASSTSSGGEPRATAGPAGHSGPAVPGASSGASAAARPGATAAAPPLTRPRAFAVRPGARLADPGSLGVTSLSFSPDGTRLLTSDGDLWDLRRHARTSVSGPNNRWAGLDPSGATAALADGRTAGATVWSVATGQLIGTFTDPNNAFDLTAAYSPDGRLLAVGADGGPVYVWRISGHHLVATLSVPDVAESVSFTPDGRALVVANAFSTYLVDIASGHVTAKLPGGWLAALSPHGGLLASASQSGVTYLYRWAAGSVTQAGTLRDSRCGSPLAVAISPDEGLAVVADGRHACVWDTATRKLAAIVADPGGAGVTGTGFSPDGRTLVTGDDNGSVYLWTITGS